MTVVPMKKAVKERWLEALRDEEEYTQGRNILRSRGEDEDCFCCLGVLTDLAVQEGVAEWRQGKWGGWKAGAIDGIETVCGVLLDPVSKWAGLKDWTPTVDKFDAAKAMGVTKAEIDAKVGRNGSRVGLIELNDYGFTFAQIADVIEHCFPVDEAE
jgi:hypothetical protein